MNDPNVKAYPIYATARSPEEFQKVIYWRSAAEILSGMKNDDPDYMIDGKTAYERRAKPILEWFDAQMKAHGWSIAGKTDYQKTAVIRQFIEAGLMLELINFWRPGFQFTTGDCVPRAEAIKWLMVAMDFRLFSTVGCTVTVAHATNAYWDSESNAVRFIDSPDNGWGVWNLFVDEFDEKGFILDVY
jgi:hypothetical protein